MKPSVPYAISALLRNLAAGLRLAFLLPVARLAFRIDLLQLVVLFLLSAAIDVGLDWVRTSPDRVFSLLGAGTEFYAVAVLLFVAALLALMFRQRALVIALPVIVFAALPVVQIAQISTSGAEPISNRLGSLAPYLDYLLFAWIIVVLIRAVAIALDPPAPHRYLRALGGGLLLAAPIWFSDSLAPSNRWWVEPAQLEAADGLTAGSEAVLAAQSFLLNHLLEDLSEERAGTTDLYFVGFAPYGGEDVFRKDVEAARDVMDRRWGTTGRSLLLVNNPQTLMSVPFATVTNLRETLNELGAVINPDEDIVMLYLASHGRRDHRLAADLPPLSLVELSPAGLKALLDDAQIKWRVIVVSSCYAGGYIEPLRDEYTLIITASQTDRISFGCGDRSDATFFGEAYFQQALASGSTFIEAFERAKVSVGERERREGYSPPSNPQMFVGEQMAAKLATLGRTGKAGGVSARTRWRIQPASIR